MERITRIRKIIHIVSAGMLVLLFIIVLNFGIHAFRTEEYNSVERVETADSQNASVDVDIHPRGQATDSWEKTDAFPDTTLYAKIYEATISNSTGATLRDWTLQIDIQDDCYLNNAWNGTVEIHQFVKGIEQIQRLSLQNYNKDELTLSYYIFGQDLMIPLSKGDYIVYYPAMNGSNNENEIVSTSEYSGSLSIGFIFYSITGNENLSAHQLTYYLHKGLWEGKEAEIFKVLLPIWILCTVTFLTVSILVLRFEKRIRKQNTATTDFLEMFANFVDAKEENMSGHSQRVAEYSAMIAMELGMKQEDVDNIFYAGLVHDIGKCHIPDYILRKPTGLSEEEFEIIKTHTSKGAQMLEVCTSIPHIADGALYHHERYDGKGYPTGKAGEEIPLIGRIICVADSFDVMNEGRIYQEKQSREKTMEELVGGKGSQFDPVLVDAFFDALHRRTASNWEME